MTPFEVGMSGSNVVHDVPTLAPLAAAHGRPGGVPAPAPVGAIMFGTASAASTGFSSITLGRRFELR